VAISKLGVLGGGTMGAGIVQVALQAGINVVLVDIAPGVVDKAKKSMNKNWSKMVDKGKLDAAAVEKYNASLTISEDIKALKDCEVIIEAIVEIMDIKKKVAKQLDELCPPSTIIASNTSALSITEIAAASNRPDKFLGMHFFNPVPVMKLVEVIPGVATSQESTDTIVELVKFLDKDPVLTKETPGFIVNRLLVPYLNEAAIVLGEGVAGAEDIDKAMKLGANMPIGPLALLDMVGVDIAYNVMQYFYNEFGDSKYRPALILRQKLRANQLGIKTGKGFYEYSK
jgi:3-hydroxybutyryl-CoA dehydrogenase